MARSACADRATVARSIPFFYLGAAPRRREGARGGKKGDLCSCRQVSARSGLTSTRRYGAGFQLVRNTTAVFEVRPRAVLTGEDYLVRPSRVPACPAGCTWMHAMVGYQRFFDSWIALAGWPEWTSRVPCASTRLMLIVWSASAHLTLPFGTAVGQRPASGQSAGTSLLPPPPWRRSVMVGLVPSHRYHPLSGSRDSAKDSCRAWYYRFNILSIVCYKNSYWAFQ